MLDRRSLMTLAAAGMVLSEKAVAQAGASPHVATIQEIYAAFGRGDMDAMLERLDPLIEWDYGWNEPLPLYRLRRGRSEVPGFFAELVHEFEFVTFQPFAFLEGASAEGLPMVCACIDVELRARTTGKTVKDIEVHLWTFGVDGKAARLRHLIDTRQIAAALTQ